MEGDDAITIGSAVTHSVASEHPLIRRYAPLLARACGSIGSRQIRNRGTIGGNVANAAACADTMPALVCHGATARVNARDGEFGIPVADIAGAPGESSLPARSLILAFQIPKMPDNARSAYYKIGRRQAQSIARLSLACLGCQDEEGYITEIRVVPGACTPQMQRFDRVEEALLGEIAGDALARKAGMAGAEQMIALSGRRWSTDYKATALSALIERSVSQLFGSQTEAARCK